MDSNKIQNEQTNTFSGGMNTDAADHVLGNDQYRDALNLRYVNNKESATGSLKVIDGFKNIFSSIKKEIIETTQVGQYGIFFTQDENGVIQVYRFPLEKKDLSTDDIKMIFGPCSDWNIYELDTNTGKKTRNRLSIVGRQEGPDNIKLYIADGIHQILIMDVLNDDTIPTSINDISTNSYESLLPPKISDITYGSLKAGKNQYAFQFYSKYKQQTSMSPLSRLINIVNIIDDGYEFNGANEGNFTNMGVKLKIQIPDDFDYDLIKIYRVYYQQNSETPDVDLIFDGRFVITTENKKNYFYYLDSSNNSIGKISVNDFNSKFGLYMIPRVIESKDDYLFAAQIKEYRNTNKSFDNINTVSISASSDEHVQFLNVNDDYTKEKSYTVNEVVKNNWEIFNQLTKEKDCWNAYTQNEDGIDYGSAKLQMLYTFPDDNREQFYGGSGKNIDWRFITTILPADYSTLDFDKIGTRRPSIGYNSRKMVNSDGYKYYIRKDGVLIQGEQFRVQELKNDTYQHPMVANQLLSLRRGETYRFGIIFTDKKGVSSPVKWITDITVPDIHIDGFQSFMNGLKQRELSVMPIGVEFKLHDIDNEDIYSYEIVRCNRGSNDIRVISQGVLSRPVIKKFMDDSIQKDQYYTPSGFVTTNRLNIDPPYNRNQLSYNAVDTNYRVNNFSNQNLFQFISPEFSYTNKSIIDFIDKSNVNLDILKYLFSLNSGNKIVEQTININNSYNVQGGTLRQESFNTTDFICRKGVLQTALTFPLPFKFPVKNGDTLQFDQTNELYKNSFLYNNLITYDQINNIYGAYDVNINTSHDLLVEDCKYSVNMPSDYIASGRITYDIEYAQRIKYQYFKLYSQSNSVLVNDHNPLDPYVTYQITEDNKLTGYSVIQHDVKNQYGINSKQISESLKWNDLFEVKNDKTEQKFSDKLNLVGEHGFCNVVCWGQYNEQPKGIKKKDIHLTDIAMYSLGGTSLLFTIDGKLKKQLKHNDKILSETIGTDNILTMTEKTSEGIFTTKTIYYPDGASKNEYVYEGDGYIKKSPYIDVSSFGTFLCNITRNCIPYGGYTKVAKDNSKYYSYSDIKEFNNNENNVIEVFSGDTYIGPFEYTSAHKVSNRVIGLLTTMNVQYAIPVESSINMYIDHGYKFSRNTNNVNVSWVQEQPSNVDGVFKQTVPQYSYNTAYSLNKTIGQNYSTISYDTKDKQSYPYRCRYSEKKENGELEDSWQNFKAANYIDVDPNYGKITGLKRFKNNLMFWQEKSFGAFSVNERTAVTDNNNHEVLLGSGGLLSRYDYVSTTSGLEDNVFAYAITTQSLYWIDAFNTVFCQYNGGGDYKQISITKNINTVVSKEYRTDGEYQISRYKVLTDPRYNEVYFTSKDGVFVFNELQQAFISKYSYSGYCDSIIGKYDTFIANKTESRDVNGIINSYTGYIDSLSGNNHTMFNKNIDFKLVYVVNAEPNIVKVFDNVRFGANEGMAKQFYASYSVNDGAKCSTGNINPLKDISNRYYDYRYAIPRMIDPSELNQLYGSRLRGKSTYCTVNGEASSDDMQLHYITTKFRTLWS